MYRANMGTIMTFSNGKHRLSSNTGRNRNDSESTFAAEPMGGVIYSLSEEDT